MATSLTFGPALTHCSAAPRPRPPRRLPQPIRPTRITSLPAACTLATALQVVAKAAPATVVAEVLRKSRREALGASLCGIVALVVAGTATAGLPGFLHISFVSLAAFLGATGTTVLIYRTALNHGRLQPYALLLTGVVFNAFCGALIMLVNSLTDFYQSHGVLFWLMGSLAAQDYTVVCAIGFYVLLGAGWLIGQSRRLNLLSLGEEGAAQLGVDVETLRRRTFLATSLLVGAIVSVSGMIGFVGLIVPHLLRLLCGADHRLLLPASVLGGAIFLVWADTLARTVVSPTELPVGVVTAMCGGPFFLYLLKKEERRRLLGEHV